MNAFTGGDYTMYPFSTQNQSDYANLLAVYLDASFFPRLERLDFLQEGHRLEFEVTPPPDAATTPLTRTGVVFNEMHGALADSTAVFREQLSAALYPTTTYGHNSGGDPKDIPNLTWPALRRFHAQHYHPANAWFYTYGNFPLEWHLEQIDRLALSRPFAGPAPDTSQFVVPLERALSAPLRLETTGPPSPGQELDAQCKSTVVWLLHTPVTDVMETFSLQVLSELLLSGPSAPLYRTLLEARLGSGYAPMTGFEGHNKQPTFGVGVVGATEADALRVPQLVRDTLEACARDGFPQERIDSILHQLELANKHVTTSFGLNAGMAAVHPWLHGGDPVAVLEFDRWIAELKARIAQGGYFEGLIRERLLHNTHHVVGIQRPDVQYSATLKAAERAQLDAIRAALTPADVETIVADSLALKKQQDEAPNVECLPTLSEKDIPLTKERTRVRHATVRVALQPTNGISYLNLSIDAARIPEPLLRALPLWTSLVTSVGADGLDHRQLAQEMELYTGGISFSPSIATHLQDANRYQVSVSGHAHCLDRNADKMMDLLRRVFEKPDWSDRENVAALVEQSATGMLESLTRSGHSYAARTAAAVYGRSFALLELWNGVSQVSYLSSLAQGLASPDTAEAVLDALLADFAAIEGYLRKGMVRAQVNTEALLPSVRQGALNLFGPYLDSDRFHFVKVRKLLLLLLFVVLHTDCVCVCACVIDRTCRCRHHSRSDCLCPCRRKSTLSRVCCPLASRTRTATWQS